MTNEKQPVSNHISSFPDNESTSNLGRVIVIYQDRDAEFDLVTTCCSVELTNAEMEAVREEERQVQKAAAGDDSASIAFISSFKTQVNAERRFYMGWMCDLVRGGGHHVDATLPGMARTIIAMLGPGNYVFDTTGSFLSSLRTV
jgi:hypothetical protein